jgi:hypothetical protein
MKKLFDVIFYNNYQFFVNVMKDPDPLSATKFVIVFIWSADFISFIGPFLLYFFKIPYYKPWFWVFVLCVFWLIYYFYFTRSGRAQRILKEKPMLFNSGKITSVIVWICSITVPIFTITSMVITRKVLAAYWTTGKWYTWN